MRMIPCKTCGKPITVYGADDRPDYKPECMEHRLIGARLPAETPESLAPGRDSWRARRIRRGGPQRRGGR